MTESSARSIHTLVESLRRADMRTPERSLLAATELFCGTSRTNNTERLAYLALFGPLFSRASDDVRRSIAKMLAPRADMPDKVKEMIAPYMALAEAVRPAPVAPVVSKPAPRTLVIKPVGPPRVTNAAPAQTITIKPVVAKPAQPVAAPLSKSEPVYNGRDLADLAMRFLEVSGEQREMLLERILTTPKAGIVDLGTNESDVALIEGKALSRQAPAFLTALSEALGLGIATTRMIAADDEGEPLVIALLAAGLSKQAIVRTVMLMHEKVGRSVERVHALASLAGLVDLESATMMVAAWRRMPMGENAPAPQRPIHGPDLGDVRARAMGQLDAPAPQRPIHGPDLGDVKARA